MKCGWLVLCCLYLPIYRGKNISTLMAERSADLVGEEDFSYFGYGSNLLRERLQLRNPSAVQVAVGYLKGYKLAFGTCTGCESSWGGGTATIIPSPEDDVWGVVWHLKAADRRTLDEQEGVSSGIYSPIEVRIQQENTGKEITCLTYQLNSSNFTLPSPIYKEVIYTGAQRSGLPAEYLKKLDAIRTNTYNGRSQFLMEIQAMLNQLQNSTVKY